MVLQWRYAALGDLGSGAWGFESLRDENPLFGRMVVLFLLAGRGAAIWKMVQAAGKSSAEGIQKVAESLFKPAPHEAVRAKFEPSPSAETLLEDIRRMSQPSTSASATSYAFISYSHKDEAYVKRLIRILSKRGLRFWVDSMIPEGANWNRLIGQKIRSADAFIIVMTPNAEASDRVQAEMELGLSCYGCGSGCGGECCGVRRGGLLRGSV